MGKKALHMPIMRARCAFAVVLQATASKRPVPTRTRCNSAIHRPASLRKTSNEYDVRPNDRRLIVDLTRLPPYRSRRKTYGCTASGFIHSFVFTHREKN